MAGNGQKIEIPQLRPTDLFDKRRQRDATKLASYNRILEQIYTRVNTVGWNDRFAVMLDNTI
jgi:hypothetical protein